MILIALCSVTTPLGAAANLVAADGFRPHRGPRSTRLMNGEKVGIDRVTRSRHPWRSSVSPAGSVSHGPQPRPSGNAMSSRLSCAQEKATFSTSRMHAGVS